MSDNIDNFDFKVIIHKINSNVNEQTVNKNELSVDEDFQFSFKEYSERQKENLINSNTDLDVENYNCSLSANEMRKIFKDHGIEEKEALRGQRAVTDDDIVRIPKVIQSPESITLSPKPYNGKPVIDFTKNIEGKMTVSAVVSDKHLDLFIQTAYVGIKKETLPLR